MTIFGAFDRYIWSLPSSLEYFRTSKSDKRKSKVSSISGSGSICFNW